MPRKKKTATKKPIDQYVHSDKERINNPQVGLVNENTDKELGQKKKQYTYDPHIDPNLQFDQSNTRKEIEDLIDKGLNANDLDAAKEVLKLLKKRQEPYLNWAGKAEHTSFEVSTVSLHIHERIDPTRIIKEVKKENGEQPKQLDLFEQQTERPLREAVDFYKHKDGWTNRLIAGDSLLVMNSLLEKEGMAGKVQMIYFDPPYGIKYGSNFQPFVNKREVKDGKDEDLTQEPETIKAFRDTWELGIHSYLAYMRDRLLLAKELLHDSGSIFVQISDENVHMVRNLLDEIFGEKNFVVSIIFTKTGSKESGSVDPINDYLIWFSKLKKSLKFNRLFKLRSYNDIIEDSFKYENENGELNKDIPSKYKLNQIVRNDPITSDGFREKTTVEVEFDNKKYYPGQKNHWKTSVDGLKKLDDLGRLVKNEKSLQYKRLLSDYPVKGFSNLWTDLGGASGMKYIVQTNEKATLRAILMTTDPGEIALDITCGSGTTAKVAEQFGRRWITCDTSRVAITLAKQRLMTANFDYYKLTNVQRGISSGFEYKTVPHITLKQLANDEPPGQETLYDQPLKDNSKIRVTGPFTVEAVPSPTVQAIEETEGNMLTADNSIAHTGQTLRLEELKDELQKKGIRASANQHIKFKRVELFEGTKYIQAKGETENDEQVLIVYGSDHAPLEQRVVEFALDEARSLKPDILLFCAYQFDPEARKDIDETNADLIGFKLLAAEMNMDLQTKDLKKKQKSDDSFWLIGSPNVELQKQEDNTYKIEVKGFDYYNPKTGKVEGGDAKKIAMWMLDHNYDGRSIYPNQVFFPMAGAKDGWAKLAKNLKAEIDEEKIDTFKGTISLPFKAGKKVAVKLIDDRGIESLKILEP